MCLLQVDFCNSDIFFFLLSRLHNIFWKNTVNDFFWMHKNRIADFENGLAQCNFEVLYINCTYDQQSLEIWQWKHFGLEHSRLRSFMCYNCHFSKTSCTLFWVHFLLSSSKLRGCTVCTYLRLYSPLRNCSCLLSISFLMSLTWSAYFA